VSQWFELVVFTASMEIYGTAVADKLDGEQGMLRRRYYRQHCTLDFGSYTKDLSAICSDLASVFILDNSPGAYRAYPGTYISSSRNYCVGLGVAFEKKYGTKISVEDADPESGAYLLTWVTW
jgi:CTD nuclear envelope phosphatase 1